MVDRPNYLQENGILFVLRWNNNIALLVGEEASERVLVAINHFMVMTVKTSKIAPGFLAWWLNQRLVQHFFEQQ